MPDKSVFEYSFNPGDVLLFDKNVAHKSSPLLSGELKTRSAVICRFVDWDSRLDLKRFNLIQDHLQRMLEEKHQGNKEAHETLKRRSDPFFDHLFSQDLVDGELVRKYLEHEESSRFLLAS